MGRDKKDLMSSQGCYFCAEYNDNRIVRNRRKLYTSIVPRMAGELEFNEDKGDCTGGFDLTACEKIENYISSRSASGVIVSADISSSCRGISFDYSTCAISLLLYVPIVLLLMGIPLHL